MPNKEPYIAHESEKYRVYYYEEGKTKRSRSKRYDTLQEAQGFINDLNKAKEALNQERSTMAFLGYFYLKIKKGDIRGTSYCAVEGMIRRELIIPYGKEKIRDFCALENLNSVKEKILDANYSLTYTKHIFFYLKEMAEIGVAEEYLTPKEGYNFKKAFKRFGFDNMIDKNLEDENDEEDETEKSLLTIDELIKFLRRLKEERSKWYVFYLVLTVALLRRGEIIGLKRKAINLKNKTLRVFQQAVVCGVSHKTIIQMPKTKNSYRKVHLPDFVCKVLEEYFKEYKITDPDAYVFFGQFHPLGISTVENKFLRFRENKKNEYGIKREKDKKQITFHTFRRTGATLMSQQNLNDMEHFQLKEFMGHAKYATTANDYIMTNKNLSPKISRFFDKLLGDKL